MKQYARLIEVKPEKSEGIICVNCNGYGAPLNIGGLPFEHGIGTSGPAALTIAVPPGMERFEAWAGIDSEAREGSAVMRILADDVVVFDSGRISAQLWFHTINPNKPCKVCVPVTGGTRLTLLVETDHDTVLADWADAVFTGAGVPLYTKRSAVSDTLAPVPPMGVNTWNAFGPEINEAIIHEYIDRMIEDGYLQAGYSYLCLDDGWQDDSGFTWDTQKFPSGMKALGAYVHARGLQFGMYTRPMWVLGREVEMAEKFAEWEIDFLKYDFSDHDAREANRRMAAALQATGRTVVFNACEWGKNRPWEWAREIGAHSWRVTYDVMDRWLVEKDCNSGIGILNAARQTEALGKYAGPGGWNDPDMLIVGLGGKGFVSGLCTPEQYRTQFSLWCLLSAPLFIGCDIRKATDETREILLNTDAIAICRDTLGVPGWRIKKRDTREVWVKPLSNDEWAIGLLNCGDEACDISISLNELYLTEPRSIYNVWTHEQEGNIDDVLERQVQPYETVLLRLGAR